MDIAIKKSFLKGSITPPTSKSHTIRALLLAAMSNGLCHIKNPLISSDCISTRDALPLMGVGVDFTKNDMWTVTGAGESIHKPCDVVNVGNSGSLLYFLCPIAATFCGWSVFTGDESIKKRPIKHLLDALEQLGAKTYLLEPLVNAPPALIYGPIKAGAVVTAGEVSSQYISGLMMAATRLKGTTQIKLTHPKETPYLTMTQKWLQKVGAKCDITSDFSSITVTGPFEINSFDAVIPCDWEAVAFPLVAALMTGSSIEIQNVDSSGTQGDDKIVEVLQSVGAPIVWDKQKNSLFVNATSKTYMTTEQLPGGELHINLSFFPDAICALAVVSCFIEGKVVLEDLSVCRNKETDRVEVLERELKKFGSKVETTATTMTIYGHSPITKQGEKNKDFCLHSATAQSYKDHRVAMAFSCLGLALEGDTPTIIKDAQCCAVSFPDFFNAMQKLGADFSQTNL